MLTKEQKLLNNRLRGYHAIKSKIQAIQALISLYTADIAQLKSPGGGAGKRSGISDPTAALVDTIDKLTSEHYRCIKQLTSRLKDIEADIALIDDPREQSACYRYYILGETWEAVAVWLGYKELRSVYRLQERALTSIIKAKR